MQIPASVRLNAAGQALPMDPAGLQRADPARGLDPYEAARAWCRRTGGLLQRIQAEALAAAEVLKDLPAGDRDRLVAAFVQVISVVKHQVDRDADAYTLGTLLERGIGYAPLNGRFLRYVRATESTPAQLLVGASRGSVRHLSAGVSARAFCSSGYGPPERLASTDWHWHGFEAGLGALSVSGWRGRGEDSSVRGLSCWLNVGVNVGPVPISGLGLLQMRDQAEASYLLTTEEVQRLERALSGARSWGLLHRVGRWTKTPLGRRATPELTP